MPTKKKTVSRKTLRNKADRQFSLYIRRRDGRCQRCGTTEKNLQCAHIISRTYLKVRWYPLNAMALCFGCHKYFTHHPLEWEDFVTYRLGAEPYARMRALATDVVGKIDYEEILAKLDMLDRLLDEGKDWYETELTVLSPTSSPFVQMMAEAKRPTVVDSATGAVLKL